MPQINIVDVHAEGNTLTARVDIPASVTRFFDEDRLVVEYDRDISAVPEHKLTIPVLGHVCPVAWATGTDVSVDVVDEGYYNALPAVNEALRKMYPEFISTSRVRANEICTERPDRPFEETGQLFSGGVDSLSTYIHHRHEDPQLISVHGWVVEAEDQARWEETKRYFDTFAEKRGLEARTIRSNMLEFLNGTLLDAHFRPYYDGSWYSNVGHGLGLLSLCAPLTYEAGIGQLYIASSHTEEYGIPWGSHPTIDDNVAWTGTSPSHDGYERNRQEKIEAIARYARTVDDEFTIRTCTYDDTGGNCNNCEKCYRTMIGLKLAGVDPNEFGYEYSHDVLSDIRNGFESSEWILTNSKPYFWGEIQSRVPTNISDEPAEVRSFYRWLSNADFEQFTASSNPPLSHRLLRTGARHVPYRLYKPLYSLYSDIRSGTTLN
jgi:hypothetical protein